MAERQDSYGRDPQYVRVLNAGGDGFLDLDDASAPAYLTQTVTIANAGTLSPEVDTTGRSLAAIIMPAAWTAAVLTFQGSNASGGTFADVYDDQGNEVVVQAAASRAIGLDAVSVALAPYRYLKIRSGTSASAVAQGASRDMQVIFKGY